MGEQKASPEDGFKAALEDLLPVIERLAPFARDVDDLAGMVRLALENEGQLRLLMTMVLKK